MQALDKLKEDIKLFGVALGEAEWLRLSNQFQECRFSKGDIILSQSRVAEYWLFVTDGIVASEQSTEDGNAPIARFFEEGQLCSNLSSAWKREVGSDNLVAITSVEGVLLRNTLFREQYLNGGGFGEYLRTKAMQTLLFDKDIICAKTSNDLETRYGFIEANYSGVLQHTAQKDIARFLGVTPQGLNRFLKNRRHAVD